MAATEVGSESGDHLRRIEEAIDPGLAQLDLEDLLVDLLDRVRELLDVDTAAILLLDSAGLFATAARGIEEEVRQGVRIPLGRGFAGRVAAEKRPVIIENVDHADVLNPILREKGIRSLLGVPLLVDRTVIGVLHVGTLTTRRFTDSDSALLQLVAGRVALATQLRISRRARAAALTLQRSLLPTALPNIPGLDFAARYVPGDGEVGGDWYDVFPLPSGWLCLIVGDIVGCGLNAAIAMGRIRNVLRAHTLEHNNPATALQMLDRHIHHFEHDVMATVLCAMLNPTHELLVVSSAGHPPPVSVSPGRRGSLLNVPPDLPVGIDPTRPRRTTTIALAAETCLCFYTDGLVERRHISIDHGLERLCNAMSVGPAETICASVMTDLLEVMSAGDDVAVLVLSLQPPNTNHRRTPSA